jgi:threonyl-tRNA synthetase
VVGEEEMKAGSVSVRNYKTKAQEVEALDDFLKRAVKENSDREL